jgi:hypothetical protein
MLSAIQMVRIATRSNVLPLRVSDLGKMYSVKPLTLRAIAVLMEKQKTYLQCEIRDLSLLTSVNSYAEFQAKLPSLPAPSKATLQEVVKILGTAGSIKTVSPDYKEIGIAGTLGPLASLTTLRLDVLVGVTPPMTEHAPKLATGLRPEPELSLTSGQWLALGGALATIGGIIIVASIGTAAVPAFLAYLVLGASEPAAAAGLAGYAASVGIGAQLEGVYFLSVGIAETIANALSTAASTSSATTCFCPPTGGTIDPPVDAGDAGSGVFSTTETPDAYVGYTSPDVNIASLPPPPVDTGKESSEGTGKESSEGTGDEGTGDEGTGDEGTGDEGTGDEGTGDEGTGDESTGDEGTGDEGTGDECSAQDGEFIYPAVLNAPIWERYAI